MAKIEAYKFINPGMAQDNASEGSLVGRKLVLGYNRIGKTLTGMGNVIKDIENIEIARIKNEDLEDRFERRQAQRERDADAEELTERKGLEKGDKTKKSKSKIKGFFGRSKIGKGLMSMLPAWAQALEPIFRLFVEILKITVIKEMLEWISKPENKEKLETFFHKANVIFTKHYNTIRRWFRRQPILTMYALDFFGSFFAPSFYGVLLKLATDHTKRNFRLVSARCNF